jgi:hypothetical protein
MPGGIAKPLRDWQARETYATKGSPAMASSNPEDRVLIARIAAADRWGRTPDRTAATAPARAGLRAKFAREADPEGVLTAAELERRIDQLTQAHMLRMSRNAKMSRQRARSAEADALAADAELAALGGDAHGDPAA